MIRSALTTAKRKDSRENREKMKKARRVTCFLSYVRSPSSFVPLQSTGSCAPHFDLLPVLKKVPGIINDRSLRRANQSRRLANACNVAQGTTRCGDVVRAGLARGRNSTGMLASYTSHPRATRFHPLSSSRRAIVRGRVWVPLTPILPPALTSISYDIQFAGTSNPAIYITPW